MRCTYDPDSRGGNPADGRKIKGTIHWVDAHAAVNGEVRLYDRLFATENPDECEEGKDFLSNLNPDSLEVIAQAKLEPALANLPPETRVQFERIGYFCTDRRDHREGAPVFNRTVGLKDSWAKIEQKQATAKPAAPAPRQESAPENVVEIGIEDFARLKLVTAKVLTAEAVPGADKLLKLQIDCGDQRQIVAGVARWYKPEELVGKTIVVVANLKPAVLCGVESAGMLLAAKTKKALRLLTVDGEMPPGVRIG